MEYLLEITPTEQSESLLKYLKTLEFIQIRPIKAKVNSRVVERKPRVNKIKNNDFVTFLENLPETSYNQDDVNNAIKTIRK